MKGVCKCGVVLELRLKDGAKKASGDHDQFDIPFHLTPYQPFVDQTACQGPIVRLMGDTQEVRK